MFDMLVAFGPFRPKCGPNWATLVRIWSECQLPEQLFAELSGIARGNLRERAVSNSTASPG